MLFHVVTIRFLTGQPGVMFGNCLKIYSLNNSIDPFTVFQLLTGTKISEIAKFESDTSQLSEDIALQS